MTTNQSTGMISRCVRWTLVGEPHNQHRVSGLVDLFADLLECVPSGRNEFGAARRDSEGGQRVCIICTCTRLYATA